MTVRAARRATAQSARVPAVAALTVLLTLSASLLAPVSTAAAPVRSSGPGVTPNPLPRSEHRAVELLRRVAKADRSVTYSGVQFVSAWSPTGVASTVAEVQNVPGQGTALRVRGSGAGPAAAMFTAGSADDGGTSLGGGPVELLVHNYTLRYGGRANATGRRAQVVDMLGAGDVLAARFWVDRESGLLLRRELYDDSGRTVRASAFVQVRVGKRAAPSHLPPMASPAAARTLTSTEVTQLQRNGWACPATMADYLTLYDTRRVETASGSALHLSYSDGLSTVSVFQQAGSIGADGLEGYEAVQTDGGVRYLRSGIPEQVVWSADGVVYSIVADAPPDVVARVVADLPAPSAPQGGMLDRLGRGLTRVGSWVNPFA